MFFKRKNEFSLMRKELIEYYYHKYEESCDKQLNDFAERALSSLRGDVVFDDSFVKQSKIDAKKSLNIASWKIDQISNMTDGDVKQLYYQVFGRWSPIER